MWARAHWSCCDPRPSGAKHQAWACGRAWCLLDSGCCGPQHQQLCGTWWALRRGTPWLRGLLGSSGALPGLVARNQGRGESGEGLRRLALVNEDTCVVKAGENCRWLWQLCWWLVSSVTKTAGFICRSGHREMQFPLLLDCYWQPLLFFFIPSCSYISQLC